jgi:hypothetical protein
LAENRGSGGRAESTRSQPARLIEDPISNQPGRARRDWPRTARPSSQSPSLRVKVRGLPAKARRLSAKSRSLAGKSPSLGTFFPRLRVFLRPRPSFSRRPPNFLRARPPFSPSLPDFFRARLPFFPCLAARGADASYNFPRPAAFFPRRVYPLSRVPNSGKPPWNFVSGRVVAWPKASEALPRPAGRRAEGWESGARPR